MKLVENNEMRQTRDGVFAHTKDNYKDVVI